MPRVTKPTKAGHEFRGYFTGAYATGVKYYTDTLRSLVVWKKQLTGEGLKLYAYWTVFTYVVDPNTNKVTITGFIDNPAISGTLTIPSTIEGYEVVGLESEAMNTTNTPELGLVTDIVVPASISYLGMDVFAGTSADVTFPTESVITKITAYSFSEYAGTTFVVPDSVTEIENNAFDGCTSLTNIVIPSTVTTIGLDAFAGCSNLNTITVPLSSPYSATTNSYLRYYFGGRSYYTGATIPASLKTIYIAEGTTTIPAHAFEDCTGLTAIHIPKTVTNIESGAFKNVTADIFFAADSTIETIPAGAFKGYKGALVSIPNSVTSIGSEAFSGCVNLGSTVIPASVTTIGARAFADVTSNVSFAGTGITTIGVSAFENYAGGNIVLPDSVTTIAANAFKSANKITAIDTKNVTSIGASAFNGASELATVTVGPALSSVATGAFDNCPKLTSFTVDGSNTSYSATNGILYSYNGEKLIRCPEAKVFDAVDLPLVIPGSVTSIEPGAFLNCRNLTSVTLPAGLQSIGAQAFKTVPIAASPAFVFPDGLLSIGPSAFESCGELTVVSIPSSVNSIGTAAFAACNKLTAINVA